MKTLSRLLTVALVFLFVGTASATTLTGPGESDEATVNWKKYSKVLVEGIRSDNDGLRESAMRLALQYADQVDVSSAIVDLMAIYRNAESNNVRTMAALTLASIDSDFADGYLRMSANFEQSESVKKTLVALGSQ